MMNTKPPLISKPPREKSDRRRRCRGKEKERNTAEGFPTRSRGILSLSGLERQNVTSCPSFERIFQLQKCRMEAWTHSHLHTASFTRDRLEQIGYLTIGEISRQNFTVPYKLYCVQAHLLRLAISPKCSYPTSRLLFSCRDKEHEPGLVFGRAEKMRLLLAGRPAKASGAARSGGGGGTDVALLR